MSGIFLEEQESTNKLRKADFKAALVLLCIAILILLETLKFPMTGSYGGVESQWYVSPALFPLILVSVLLASSALLLITAIKARGYRDVFNYKGWIGDFGQSINRDRWFVIIQLLLYIYIFIPSCDFFLCTANFLLAITFRFYLSNSALMLPLYATQTIAVAGLFGLRASLLDEFYFFSMEIVSDEKLIAWSDSLLAGMIAINCLTLLLFSKAEKIKIVYLLATCLLVPLILVFVFTFLLQVPMPVEYGSVSLFLQWLWYDKLGM